MIYDGEVEHAIKLYNGIYENERITHRDLCDEPRDKRMNLKLKLQSVDVLNTKNCIYNWDEPIRYSIRVFANETVEDINARAVFSTDNGTAASVAFVPMHVSMQAGETKDFEITVRNHCLAPGDYRVGLDLTENRPYDIFQDIDSVGPEAFFITVRNYGSEERSLEDSEKRLWLGAWGNSRIMDTSFVMHDAQ